jgi:hypothetical protein
MLRCETNTPRVEQAILSAARRALPGRRLAADFEHGQWWITDRRTGGQWSVIDAAPGPFDFEQVTIGEED